MFRTIAAAFSVFCFSSTFVMASHFQPVSLVGSKELMETFDPIIKKVLADFNIPGMAVGVVVDGEVVYANGFGFRNVAKKLPVSPNTLFGLGSCTKSFTAFTIARLVDEGIISWDKRIIDVLPQFRLSSEHATNYLTFRDLISHRSGMARHPYMYYNSKYSRKELVDKLRYLDMAWDVRERFNYGDLMYLTASVAAEKATGRVWEDLVTEKILAPLEMKNTNFSIQQLQQSNDYALSYIEKNGSLKEMPLRDFSNIGPAAAMNSSLSDMLSWVKMLLGGGSYGSEVLLSQGSIQELFGSQIITESYSANKDALLSAYGLGWYIHPYRGHYSVSHDGGGDGYTSVVSLFPNSGLGIVILTNKNLFSAPRYLSLELADAFLGMESRDWMKVALESVENSKKSLQQPIHDPSRKVGTKPSHPLEDFVGDYEHPAYGAMKIEFVDGHLVATLHGISSRLEHWHYDVFNLAEDLQDLLIVRQGIKFTFHTGMNGDIERVTAPLEQKTADISFHKKPDTKFSNIDYLKPYIGEYEVYGITVDIILRDGNLVAMIPGQANYELEPLAEHEFNVKNDNYLVRFTIGNDALAKEVLLVLPFGAYSAQRIRH
jgi:CubicO group peptidase (beta-lactamase class C family)